AVVLIWFFPRFWLPVIYAVIVGVMITALGVSFYSGGFQSGVEATFWMILGPISAALVAGVRGSIMVIILYIVVVFTAVYLEPFARSVAPELSLNIRMQLATGNMLMMGLFAFAAVLYLMREVERYRQRADDLLLNILPGSIASRLKESPETIADGYSEVSVLFADIVDFTTLSSGADPVEIVNLLNDIFSSFDDLAAKHGLEKIKTIGDAYMVAAGIPEPRPDHAEAITEFALDMLDVVENYAGFHGEPIRLRVGINTGPIVAGVIGRQKFIYDLWGDAVNVASRMESNGLANQIQVTEAVKEKLDYRYRFQERDPIYIKGKGMMVTYLLQT
ncbi:MAG: adenylate/guanylate cyclase domain-containing protein, partial [Candidatus Promineifilaceae bacterium]